MNEYIKKEYLTNKTTEPFMLRNPALQYRHRAQATANPTPTLVFPLGVSVA